ncbi:M4 family metallopeptidase [Bacillus sp. AFS053548]|uniref:M4 family metallopeptidase n=1 Tax=Bacillus sp. AFS053548 TaxID=2033505 RepID=UPI000BFCBF00|nr:M4 family metallopeptidase [Bacillus sp. AFS053548]PGM48849.1 peptidase M4 family protein [Bacillus sp. AFS053548]
MKKKDLKSRNKKIAIPAVLSLSVVLGGVLPTVTTFGSRSASAATVSEVVNKDEIVKNFLNSKVENQLTKLANIGEQFKIISEQTDSSTGTYHVRTVEQYKGIPIFGSGQTVALDANNNVYASIGKVTQNLSRTLIPTEASISEDDAISIVKEEIQSQIGEVKNYDGIDSQLMIYPYEGKYHLAYLVKASTSVPAPGYFHYFVDAISGEVIDQFDALDEVDATTLTPVTARGLDLHGDMQSFTTGKDLSTGTSYLYSTSVYGSKVVPIATYDARRMEEFVYQLGSIFGFTGYEISTKSPTNTFTNPAAISAIYNSDKVNKYYQNIHKRNSLDDHGMTLINTVHIGVKWNNAAWNGKQMLYGDGDGIKFSSLAGGLDVAGHEMTHGVIEHSADLIYKNESGAINESLADIMGNFAQMSSTGVTEWELGEDITTPNIPGDGGLRSMSNPASKATSYMASGHYPDTYQDRYLGTDDNGGVHINSGINNKAAYLLTQGGSNNGITIKGMGRTKAEKIYYRAITLYLTPSSGFKEMREAAIQSARDLYPDKNGIPSAETQAVMDAYTSVGVN